MVIASWKGRNRRHKDEPVQMRIKDVGPSVLDYAQRFLEEPEAEVTINKAIQNILGMHFGRHVYYKEVREYLAQITPESVTSEELLAELFTKVEATASSQIVRKK